MTPPAPDTSDDVIHGASSDDGCVWLLLDPLPSGGHKTVMGAFSTLDRAELARAASPHSLSLWCVPLDHPPEPH